MTDRSLEYYSLLGRVVAVRDEIYMLINTPLIYTDHEAGLEEAVGILNKHIPELKEETNVHGGDEL